jgi:hypothetical protein
MPALHPFPFKAVAIQKQLDGPVMHSHTVRILYTSLLAKPVQQLRRMQQMQGDILTMGLRRQPHNVATVSCSAALMPTVCSACGLRRATHTLISYT